MLDPFYRAMNAIGYTHPVHPTQVNMPIGLVVGALVLGVAALILRRSSVAVSARNCTIVAFVFLFTTVAAGVMDWLHYYSGIWFFPIKVKVGLASFLFVLLVLAILVGRRANGPSAILVGLYALSFLTVTALGYFGADLVFGNRTPPGPAQYRQGEMIYRMNCDGCHPYGGNAIQPQNHIIGSDKLANLQSFDVWLRHPDYPMPPFPPERISHQQAQELYNYITNVVSQQ